MNDEMMNQGKMQDTEDVPPVVNNAKLPKMDDGSVRPRRIKNRVRRMAKDVDPVYKPKGSKRKMRLMDPMPEGEPTESAEEIVTRPDQQAVQTTQDKIEGQEQYVRLRLRVEQDEVTVVGIHMVDGPLQLPERLYAGLAYEVVRDKKRIGLGTLPDVGMRRGFANPEGEGEQRGHAIFQSPSYEFTARIPRTEFSNWALPRININVYRVKGEAPSLPVQPTLLSTQFETLRPIAQLNGIRRATLSNELIEQLDQSIRDSIDRSE